jgi:hypothetical protein
MAKNRPGKAKERGMAFKGGVAAAGQKITRRQPGNEQAMNRPANTGWTVLSK